MDILSQMPLKIGSSAGYLNLAQIMSLLRQHREHREIVLDMSKSTCFMIILLFCCYIIKPFVASRAVTANCLTNFMSLSFQVSPPSRRYQTRSRHHNVACVSLSHKNSALHTENDFKNDSRLIRINVEMRDSLKIIL